MSFLATHARWWWVRQPNKSRAPGLIAPITNSSVGLFLASQLFVASAAVAQELEPRSYTNLPVGETFMAVGVVRSEGDIAPANTTVIQDLELTIDTGVVGLAHTFALGDDSAKVDLAVGRTCYEGSAIFQGEFVKGRRCEYVDPRVRLSWNFYGAPAMDLDEFAKWNPGLVMGASVQAVIPVGTYDSANLINAGANRWMIRPGLGMSYKTGRWHYDLSASVRFYEDNDDFFDGNKVEQDPLYDLQGHLIYYLAHGRWISLNANFYGGGETTVNRVNNKDSLENSRWGATFSTPLSRRMSLKLYASTGVVTRTGSDFDTYGAALQYRF